MDDAANPFPAEEPQEPTPWLHRGPFRLRGHDGLRRRGRKSRRGSNRTGADYRRVDWRYDTDDQRSPSPDQQPRQQGKRPHPGDHDRDRKRARRGNRGFFIPAANCRPGLFDTKRKRDEDDDQGPPPARFRRQSVVVKNNVNVMAN